MTRDEYEEVVRERDLAVDIIECIMWGERKISIFASDSRGVKPVTDLLSDEQIDDIEDLIIKYLLALQEDCKSKMNDYEFAQETNLPEKEN